MIYVILAHEEPEQLYNLVKKLHNENAYFVIHIDIIHDIEPFKHILSNVPNCHFTLERYASRWGSFELVEATLHALDYIRKVLRQKRRVILLSGSDYPIKNNIYINKFLDSHKHTIFIEYEAIPRKIWYNGGRNRFPSYEMVSEEITLYAGSQWFSIPYKVISIVFNFLRENPIYLYYFKNVKVPDESFFQTLLLNSKHPYILKNLNNKNLHFIKWDKPYHHPRILTMKNFSSLKRSKALFARKFDYVISSELKENLFKDDVIDL